jgi:hypothetical protein
VEPHQKVKGRDKSDLDPALHQSEKRGPDPDPQLCLCVLFTLYKST